MEYKFTNSAENALEIANDLAAKLGHNYIGTEHILYGLVEEGTGVASKVLENQNITPENILEEIEELISQIEDNSLNFFSSISIILGAQERNLGSSNISLPSPSK